MAPTLFFRLSRERLSMTVTIEKGGPLTAPLDDLKAYLKISLDEEDAALTDLIRSASEAAERFLGQLIVARGVEEVLGVRTDWQKLSIRPVRSITSVIGIPADGPEFALAVANYAIDIDAGGTGWVRVSSPGSAGRVRVRYQAGLVSDEDDVPDAIQHAIVRLAGEWHAAREGLEAELPASVSALLRPWRRMVLA
jgi:uncharacterized phiE125 gp8 family phage protein